MSVQPSSPAKFSFRRRVNLAGRAATSIPAEIAIITEAQELEAIAKDWADLAGRTLVPAGAASPGWLTPVFKHLGSPKGARIMTIRHGGKLSGLFPLARQQCLAQIPLSTPLTFSGVPMIDRDRWRAVFTAFLEAIGRRSVLFSAVPSDGPFWDMLSDVADGLDLHVAVLDQWERAAFIPNGTVRRMVRRQFRAQAAQGIPPPAGAARRDGEARKPHLGAGRAARALDRAISWRSKPRAGRAGAAARACSRRRRWRTAFGEALHALAADGELALLEDRPQRQADRHDVRASCRASRAGSARSPMTRPSPNIRPACMLILDATESADRRGAASRSSIPAPSPIIR